MLCRTDCARSSLFGRFLSDTSGATAVEYGLVTFIALAIALTIAAVGDNLLAIYESFEDPLSNY